MTENPRHRYLLQAYDRHRNLEMAGRYKEIFAPEMTVEHPVYRFDLFGEKFTLDGREQVEAIYREWTEAAQCIFYAEDEQLAVGDNMVVSRAILYQQTPGSVLGAAGVDAEPGRDLPGEDARGDGLALRRPLPADRRGRLGVRPSEREFIELDPEDVLTRRALAASCSIR